MLHLKFEVGVGGTVIRSLLRLVGTRHFFRVVAGWTKGVYSVSFLDFFRGILRGNWASIPAFSWAVGTGKDTEVGKSNR